MQPPDGYNPQQPAPQYNTPIPPVPTGTPPPGIPGGGAPRSYAGPPQIRFELISEAWKLFQQQMGTWVMATLVYCVIIGIPTLLCLGPFYYSMLTMDPARANADPFAIFGPMIGMYAVIFLVVIPLSYILMGGLIRMAIRQIRGQTISIGDLFSVFDVLPNLIGSVILVLLATLVGCLLCYFPGLVVGSLLMLTLPLVVDQRLGAVEAMRRSWDALKPHWLMATLFYFVISIVGSLGTYLCYVGILFTWPLFILCIALLYRDFFLSQPAAMPVQPASNYPPPNYPEGGFTPR